MSGQDARSAASASLLEDAQALQAAAEHVEAAYPCMAALMRRCATRLYQSMKDAESQLRAAMEERGWDDNCT